MDDNFLVKLVDTNGEVEYVVLVVGNKDLGNFISNLDKENYIINDVENIGCLIQDWTDFVLKPKALETGNK